MISGNTILQNKEEMDAFRETLKIGEISKSEKSVTDICRTFDKRNSREQFYAFLKRLLELSIPIVPYILSLLGVFD